MNANYAKEMGFASLEEWHRLVSNADLSTPEKQVTFRQWQYGDGTKAGLLLLVNQGKLRIVT